MRSFLYMIAISLALFSCNEEESLILPDQSEDITNINLFQPSDLSAPIITAEADSARVFVTIGFTDAADYDLMLDTSVVYGKILYSSDGEEFITLIDSVTSQKRYEIAYLAPEIEYTFKFEVRSAITKSLTSATTRKRPLAIPQELIAVPEIVAYGSYSIFRIGYPEFIFPEYYHPDSALVPITWHVLTSQDRKNFISKSIVEELLNKSGLNRYFIEIRPREDYENYYIKLSQYIGGHKTAESNQVLSSTFPSFGSQRRVYGWTSLKETDQQFTTDLIYNAYFENQVLHVENKIDGSSFDINATNPTYHWSEHSYKLLYFENDGTVLNNINILNVENGVNNDIAISPVGNIHNPVFTEDEQSIYFVGKENNQHAIRKLELSTGLVSDVAQLGTNSETVPYIALDPGDQFIYILNEVVNGRKGLYKLEISSSQITEVFQSDYDDRNLSVSPDGSKLSFLSDRSGHPELIIFDMDNMRSVTMTSSLYHYVLPDSHFRWVDSSTMSVFLKETESDYQYETLNKVHIPDF